jgi:hypothetical protein
MLTYFFIIKILISYCCWFSLEGGVRLCDLKKLIYFWWISVYSWLCVRWWAYTVSPRRKTQYFERSYYRSFWIKNCILNFIYFWGQEWLSHTSIPPYLFIAWCLINYAMGKLYLYIQNVSRGKVIVSAILSKKVYVYMRPVPYGFRDRDISLYSCKIVDKKEILRTVSNTGIYCSSDKVGTVYLV